MATTIDGASSNWISRFIALLLAIGVGVWIYEFIQTVPGFQNDLSIEKGTYQGPVDTPMSAESLDALQDRSRGQSY